MTATPPPIDLQILLQRIEARLSALEQPAIDPSSTLRGALLQALRGLLGSKKVLVAGSTILVLAAQRVGLQLSQDTAMEITGLAGMVILGFASSDFGKEKAKLAAGG